MEAGKVSNRIPPSHKVDESSFLLHMTIQSMRHKENRDFGVSGMCYWLEQSKRIFKGDGMTPTMQRSGVCQFMLCKLMFRTWLVPKNNSKLRIRFVLLTQAQKVACTKYN